MITERDIYKTLSDMIEDICAWSSDGQNNGKTVHYIMGVNDMARNIAEKLRKCDVVTEELHESMGEAK